METPRVPLLDIVQENMPIRAQLLEALARIVVTGRFLFGPDVAGLEREMAELCGVAHGVSCASGSDALLLALMAHDIGPGDEVIVPSFTFFATASCVWRLGAKLVFADVDPDTYNLDPKSVERAITPATRAVIPVHLFGQSADMRALRDLADQHGLKIVEDAAQSIGATCGDRGCGGWGDVACFSFYPTKNLGGMGDGGMLVTRDAALAEHLRLFASHGMRPRYYHQVVGVNSRLDSFQAAALRIKLRQLPAWNQDRRIRADRYRRQIAAAGLEGHIRAPRDDRRGVHVWNQFTIRVSAADRDALRAWLQRQGIGTEIYYPIPLHRQHCFRSLGYAEGSLPVTEQLAKEVLSLPVSPCLTESQQDWVVSSLGSYFASQTAAA